MSMLTPPGMSGKKYRITGDRYPRMRRPRRRGRKVLALIATLALIGALGYGTVQLVDVFRGDGDHQDQAGDAAGQDCQPDDDAKPEALPEPEVVTVNVYNATDRAGLAQQTAQALADRGFTIGEVANAPEELDGEVTGAGLVRGSGLAEQTGSLAVLNAHLTGMTAGTVEREDATVDLVLGEDFDQLAEEDEVTAALQALAAAPGDECADGDGDADAGGDTDGDAAEE